MDRIEAAPRRLPAPRILVAIGVAIVIGTTGIVATAAYLGRPQAPVVAIASPTPTPSPTPRPTPTPTPTPRPTPTPSPTPTPTPSLDALLGTDGRLTVLLLGSDYRPAHPGNRTDVIMVVSLDPKTGAVAAASIPRDTTNFPTSPGTYRAKVNGLYQSLVGRLGQPKAAQEMKRIVGAALAVEVDSYALIGFAGVRKLVDAVGGVDVVLAKSVRDPYYWVTPKQQGVYFPAGRNHLTGDRALIFARTRKADNDFERARRQQLLVAGAVDAVRTRGLQNLPRLIGAAGRNVKTDMPLKSAPQLFEVVAKANLAHAQRIVFGPRHWATAAGGSSFTLKLDVVRGWTREWMAPVGD